MRPHLIVKLHDGRVDSVTVVDKDTGEVAKVSNTFVEIVWTTREHSGRTEVRITSPHIRAGHPFSLEIDDATADV